MSIRIPDGRARPGRARSSINCRRHAEGGSGFVEPAFHDRIGKISGQAALRLSCFLHRLGHGPPLMTHARIARSKPKPAALSKPSRPQQGKPPRIESVIHTLRGERVILDADLAKIYGVETRVLNQAVRRNRNKFPADFLLELTGAEALDLQNARLRRGARSRSQTVILKRGWNVKHQPFAFTEHGAIMAANILNSPPAVQMSVFVVRAFVKMRGLLTDTRELAAKLSTLEKELTSRLDSHETAIFDVLQRIMLLLDPPTAENPAKEMGFHTTLKSPPEE